MTLVQALEQFNRKERYWLFQHAIGKHPLSDKFRGDVSQLLSNQLLTCVKIPCYAYWAIDYHFDWIAGAIIEFAKLDNQIPSAPFRQLEGKQKLVMGNQEDVDLLIAFENTLIFVEYKAGGNWGQQRKSKNGRVDLIKKLVETHVRDQTINLHFVKISPKDDGKNGKLWLPLEYDDSNFSRVERCDEHKKADARGDYWQVKPAKTRSP
jgi:hypothetical protein